MKEIIDKAGKNFNLRKPFAIFCAPSQLKVTGIFQNDTNTYFLKDYTKKGFIIHPFIGKEIIFIPEENSEIIIKNKDLKKYPISDNEKTINELDRQKFEDLVEKTIQKIHTSPLEKIVVSRKESITIDTSDPFIYFKKLLSAYNNTFIFCVYHPEIGLWIGATPEQFLKSQKNTLTTVALAGTQVFNGTELVEWGEKEIEEQEIVSNFITSNLSLFSDSINTSASYTARAGKLLHIKTDISAENIKIEHYKDVIKVLHPTPAVCGLPKEEALEFILNEEGYNRELYAGFLGEWNKNFSTGKDNNSDLFVALRCMKVNKENTIDIYVGCGITKDSDPYKEFIETVNKSMTIKNIVLSEE